MVCALSLHVPCPPRTGPDRIGAGRSSEVFAEGPDRVVKLYRQPFEPEAVANELAASRLAHGFGLPVPEAFPKDQIRVGHWALAVGRTLSPEITDPPSVSVGIISALDRVWGKALQTDAKVSPVNYGGPLVAMDGRVQGILVPASPQSEGATAGVEWYDSGIGFAIPMDDVLKALAESGGMLGFSMYPHHLAGGPDCTLQDFCTMVARTADLMGVEQIGFGSDLCLDQPDSVVEWMRNGRWTKDIDYGEGSASNAGFPPMPQWFGDNRDFGNIERGPGRHGISNAFFLYILDPDGHRIEIYCSDYQTVDPDLEPIKWDLKDPQRQTLWGAPAPKSWFEHGSTFTGVDVREADLKATPIIAP